MAEPTKQTTFRSRAAAALRYAVSGIAPDAWFGPATPPAPQAPETARGRTWDFPIGVNATYQPRAREPLTFARLKALADGLPQVRLVIDRQKDLIEALDWRIKARPVDGKKDAGQELDDDAKAIVELLALPDKEHDWAQWIRAVVEQLFVIDAVSIYKRPTRGGGIFSLDVLDGATITPIVDELGRRPMAPAASYAQVLKGMPALHYTSDELIYYPQNFRPDRLYGYSRVEQIVDTIEIFIARGRHQAGWYSHGNMGDGFFVAPEGWTPEQILQFETRWNALMQVSVEGRRQTPWVPSGTAFKDTKIDLFDDKFEEWLMRLICFGFGVSPTPFLKQMGLGRGSAETDQDAAEAAGLKPLMQYVARLMNRILAQWFDRPDLEFTWIEDREFDPATANLQKCADQGRLGMKAPRLPCSVASLPAGEKDAAILTGLVGVLGSFRPWSQLDHGAAKSSQSPNTRPIEALKRSEAGDNVEGRA